MHNYVSVTSSRLDVCEHEAGVHRHHHLVLHLGDVLGQSVDRGADLPRHRDRVLGVAHALRLGPGAGGHRLVVDHAGLDHVDQVDDRHRCLVRLQRRDKESDNEKC